MNRRLLEEEFADNIGRAENILTIYNEVSARQIGTAEINTDLLRACVVFLHAAIEEIVRNLHISRIDLIDPSDLNAIPLAGQMTSRPKAIQLGDLKQFEGLVVENLIRNSVEEFTNRFNLNNTTELATALQRVKLPVRSFVSIFPELQPLMQRRHQIVHQMDRTDSLDPNTVPVAPIDADTVWRWHSATRAFFDAIMPLIV